MAKKKYSKKKANKKDSQIKNTVSKQTQTIEENNVDGEKISNNDIVQEESTNEGIFRKTVSCISNRFCKVDDSYNLSFSYSGKNNIQSMNSIEVRKYINEYYNNECSIEKKQILDDLKVFKMKRDDLEMSLEDDTTFLSLLTTYNAIVASSISLMVTIGTSTSKNLENFRAMITEERMLFGIGTMRKFMISTIVLVFAFYIHRLRKKSSYKRLKSVKYGINILEDKKEKLESEKKD